MVVSGKIKVKFKHRVRIMHFVLASSDSWFIYEFLEELKPYTTLHDSCPLAVPSELMRTWHNSFGVSFTEVIE